LIVLINFLIGIVGAAYFVSSAARLGALSGEFSTLALWAILTAFCNVCIAYWVAKDGDSIRELASTRSRKRIKVKEVESDEETKRLEKEEIEEFDRLGLTCRTCANFKKSECPRGEKDGNAEPCDEYVLLLEKK